MSFRTFPLVHRLSPTLGRVNYALAFYDPQAGPKYSAGLKALSEKAANDAMTLAMNYKQVTDPSRWFGESADTFAKLGKMLSASQLEWARTASELAGRVEALLRKLHEVVKMLNRMQRSCELGARAVIGHPGGVSIAKAISRAGLASAALLAIKVVQALKEFQALLHSIQDIGPKQQWVSPPQSA